MKRFNIFMGVLSFFFMVFIFACKKNIKDDSNVSQSIENSYDLLDFVIQDISDAIILDREDVHRIKQHTVSEVLEGAIDTIYLQVMVSLDKLKLKPRFYDISNIISIDPDTNKVRDLNKYADQDYPRMQVTFKNGLVRTFAIIASKITNQDLINLVTNQREHFLQDFILINDMTSSDVTNQSISTFIRHTPLLGDKKVIDTIEIKLLVGVKNALSLIPNKWGMSNTVTNVLENPKPFKIIPVEENHKNYSSVIYTFPNGF